MERLVSGRQREKFAHRRKILSEAKGIFARKGFYATTMDEIAAEAGFSKGAIYVHFKSKEELFLCLINEESERLKGKLEEIIKGSHQDPETKIKNIVRAHLSYFEEDEDFFRIAASAKPRLEPKASDNLRRNMRKRMAEYLDFLEVVMREGIAQGYFKDLNPRMLAVALVGIVHSFTAQWIFEGKGNSLRKTESIILKLFFEGVKL